MFYIAYLLRISVRTEYEVLATRENDRDQHPVHDRKDWNWARILKLLSSPGIDSKESISPAYVAWQADSITLFLLGS